MKSYLNYLWLSVFLVTASLLAGHYTGTENSVGYMCLAGVIIKVSRPNLHFVSYAVWGILLICWFTFCQYNIHQFAQTNPQASSGWKVLSLLGGLILNPVSYGIGKLLLKLWQKLRGAKIY